MDTPYGGGSAKRTKHLRILKNKETTQTGLWASSSQSSDDDNEDEESSDDYRFYDPSNMDAPLTIPMDALQAEMRPAFEEFRLTQDANDA